MKIVYISSSEIPSRTANSVHVMKMCSAFSKYVETILFAIKGESKINPYEYYESRRDFDLITVKKAKNFFGSIGYIFKVLSLLEIDKNTLIYGRHRLVIFLLSLRNTNIVYESHEIPIGRVRGWIEGLIFKQKGFEKLIVISNALKSDYLHFFSNLSDHDIVVAHDGADVPSNNRIINSKKDILKVGYVGHLFQGRGIEIIIQLARIFPDICFEVVGGMDRDVKFWKKKVSRITNIKFYGHIAHKDLSKFYH